MVLALIHGPMGLSMWVTMMKTRELVLVPWCTLMVQSSLESGKMEFTKSLGKIPLMIYLLTFKYL